MVHSINQMWFSNPLPFLLHCSSFLGPNSFKLHKAGQEHWIRTCCLMSRLAWRLRSFNPLSLASLMASYCAIQIFSIFNCCSFNSWGLTSLVSRNGEGSSDFCIFRILLCIYRVQIFQSKLHICFLPTMVQRDPIMSEMEVMLMSMLQSFITAFLNPEPTIILEILSGIVFDSTFPAIHESKVSADFCYLVSSS